jgi:uncharacterized protein YvpB
LSETPAHTCKALKAENQECFNAYECVSGACTTNKCTVPTNQPASATTKTFKAPKLKALGEICQLTNVKVSANTNINIPWIAQCLTGLYGYSLVIGAMFAVMFVIIGGVMFTLSGFNKNYATKGKEMMLGSVFGLIILATSFLILNTINPQILTLNTFNIETVETAILENEFASEHTSTGSTIVPALGSTGTLPNFKQCGEWHCFPYNSAGEECGETKCRKQNNICSSGCGITSTAMVLGFYGKGVTPPDIASWLGNQGFRRKTGPPAGAGCVGISHLAIKAVATAYNLKMEYVSRDRAKALLKQNIPIITHVQNPGGTTATRTCKYTKGGHYIVLKGYSDDGTYQINDPGTEKAANQTGTDKELFEQCKNMGLLYVHP